MNRSIVWLLLLAALSFAACEEDDNQLCTVDTDAENFRFYEFVHRASNETFVAWTSDSAVIAQIEAQLSLPVVGRDQHINGKIDRIPEHCGELNGRWSWYFVPNEWALADLSIEVCDGEPQYVEEHLQDYLDIERYCPWSAYVAREIESPFR